MMVNRLLLSAMAVLALAGCGGADSVTEPPSLEEQGLAEPHPTDRVLTADPLGGLQYRPASVTLGEGGGFLIDGIRWRTYGGRTAVGVGVRVGGTGSGDRVMIRLRQKSECAGSPTYLQWSIEPERGGKPSFHDIMSAHVWHDTCYPMPEG